MSSPPEQGLPKDSEGNFDIPAINISYDNSLPPVLIDPLTLLPSEDVQSAIDALKTGLSPNLSAFIPFGANRIGAFVATRFLTAGFARSGIAPIIEIGAVMPRKGVITSLAVRHNRANGNGLQVVYEVMLNGVATSLGLPLPTGAIGENVTPGNIPFSAGDYISVRATKPGPIGSGFLGVQAMVEVQ